MLGSCLWLFNEEGTFLPMAGQLKVLTDELELQLRVPHW